MVTLLKAILIFSFASFIQSSSCRSTESLPKNKGGDANSVTPDRGNRFTETDFEKFLTISELNREKPKKGVFETRGFVAKIYVCPACPPDAICKPCMADNIVISEEKKSLETYDLSEKEMIIFTAEAKNFEKGGEYRFKVEITTQKSTSQDLNDARLIRADLIK
ncbi:MAG: hypothetical protein HKN25_10140 [Pyrinomonadaceae bacterium]|nr:hypothetical protein [Pyrinomonadaceae bacterium]